MSHNGDDDYNGRNDDDENDGQQAAGLPAGEPQKKTVNTAN